MNEPKAIRYQRLKRRARLAEIGMGAAVLAGVACTPAAAALAENARVWSVWLPGPLQVACATTEFVLVLALTWESLVLPFVLYTGLLVERRFGQSDETAATLLGSHLRDTALRLPVLLACAAVVVCAMLVADGLWWLVAGACCTGLWAAALRVVPSVLVSIGETRPVDRRSLMSGLREIARRSGVRVTDIVEWKVDDGARATALVTGVGRQCRVFVSAEVLRDWSDDEIAVMVAHELAHHIHRDLWRDLALNASVLSLCFGVAELALGRFAAPPMPSPARELSLLPLVALAAGAAWALARPIRLAQSRAHERRADDFALRLTGEAEAFGAAVRRLSKRHLSEPRPPVLARWFFHRHPPVSERLAMAERFVKAEGTRHKGQGTRHKAQGRNELTLSSSPK